MNKDGSQSKSVLRLFYTNALKSKKVICHGRASVELWVDTWTRSVSEPRESSLLSRQLYDTADALCLYIHAEEHAKAVCNAKGLLWKTQGNV